MRRTILALVVLPGFAGAALAQEPLFLRIKPTDAETGFGPGGPETDEAIARRARAAREEIWARSDRRARVAIASVCSGCLAPEPSETGSITEAPPAAAPALPFAQNR